MQPLRFSGYTATVSPNHVSLYLPGHQQAKTVEVELIPPGQTHPIRKALKKDPHSPYWRLSEPVAKGGYYRFTVDGKPQLDWLETVNHHGKTYNRVATEPEPATHGSMLDVFQHSLSLEKPQPHNMSLGQTTHFNQNQPSESALFALVDQLPTGAIRNLLLRPVQQGGYWTGNPYVLDPNSFSSREQLRAFLDKLRQKGIRLVMDTALVNQGLQGPQYLSNMAYGLRSPYWDWFVPTEDIPVGEFPHNAYDGFKPGVLPIDDKGQVNWDRVQLRLLNVPGQPGYNAKKHTMLSISDPKPSSSDTHSFATVQPYQFPVNPQEAKKKLAAINHLDANNPKAKEALTNWSTLKLVRPAEDDSGYKWDGQIDVAKMNINNPEAAAYLQGSVTYWTRFVTYHQTQQLARALRQAAQHQPELVHTPDAWVKAIAGKAFTPMPHARKLSWQPPTNLSTISGKGLATTLLAVAPISTQGQDWATQAVLGHPALQQLLSSPSPVQRGVNQLVQTATQPLRWMGVKQTPSLEPFRDTLSRQLASAVAQLPEEQKQLLQYPKAQQMALFSLGEHLWQQLVPHHGISQHIDPNLAAVIMVNHLTQGIHKLPTKWFTQQLHQSLNGMDINSLSLAEALVNSQELGPNLRIDAAKDVGNMQQLRQAHLPNREAVFEAETDKAVGFWKKTLAPARTIYPSMSVIAELTDIEELAGSKQAAKKAFNQFNTVFTSTPDMDNLFGLAYQATHHSPSPQEFGDTQRYLGTTDDGRTGLVDLLKRRAQSVPLPSQLHFQNMLASHDYSTASHNLLHNPTIFTQDKLPYWGLENDLNQLRKELEQKAAFSDWRQQLAEKGVKDIGRSLYLLEQQANALFEQRKLSTNVMAAYRVDSKKQRHFIAPTPLDVKRQFIQDVMDHLSPQGLNLPDEPAKKALANAVCELLTEPSEARSMRAVLNNAWLDAVAAQPDLKPLTQAVNTQMTNLVRQYGAHLGYQPLDLVLDRLVNALDTKTLGQVLPEAKTEAQARKKLKQTILAKALPPVLDKLQRVLALQVGTPGMPSIYLHDFYPPGGGETVKNGTVQDRGPVALNAVNPVIKPYQDEAVWLLRLRQQYPALDNGILLNPASEATMFELSRQGVMPFIRDNGKQQVILLVNTGNPTQATWGNRVGDGNRYEALPLTQPIVENLNLNLWHLGMPQGTSYKDAKTGQHYTLDKTGKLVDQHGKGPTIHVATLLVRQ
jgi:hypothetical protein